MNGQKYYHSYTLPKLPRCCPFQILYFAGRAGEVPKLKPCPNKPGPNGWCTEHAYCGELLELAYSVGCPELEVNSSLIVLAGLANWEEYTVSHPLSRHKGLAAKLIRLRQEQLADEQRRREEILEELRQNRARHLPDGQGIA